MYTKNEDLESKQELSLEQELEQDLQIKECSEEKCENKQTLEKDLEKQQCQETSKDIASTNNCHSQSYQILEEIGHGGMGTVYKAHLPGLEKSLAIKKLNFNFVSNESALSRFKAESMASQLLSHPNLVTVYDHGISAEGLPFLVMDRIEGITLAQLISETGGIQPDQFINIFTQVCDGLIHAHSKNILHLDLKPSNIILSKLENSQFIVKIVDFGIAKIKDDLKINDPQLSQTGELLGTPVYMSPEQCLGLELNESADIYSLGCVMYEALLGRPPFLENNAILTILQHIEKQAPSFTEIESNTSIPLSIEQIVMKCLEKDPSKRFHSMEDLRKELELASKDTSILRKQIIKNEKKRSEFRLFLNKHYKKIFLLLAPTICYLAFGSQYQDQDKGEEKIQSLVKVAQMLDKQGKIIEARKILDEAINKAEILHRPKNEIFDLRVKKLNILEQENGIPTYSSPFSKTGKAERSRLLAEMEPLVYEELKGPELVLEYHSLGTTTTYQSLIWNYVQLLWLIEEYDMPVPENYKNIRSLIDEAKQAISNSNFALADKLLKNAESIDRKSSVDGSILSKLEADLAKTYYQKAEAEISAKGELSSLISAYKALSLRPYNEKYIKAVNDIFEKIKTKEFVSKNFASLTKEQELAFIDGNLFKALVLQEVIRKCSNVQNKNFTFSPWLNKHSQLLSEQLSGGEIVAPRYNKALVRKALYVIEEEQKGKEAVYKKLPSHIKGDFHVDPKLNYAAKAEIFTERDLANMPVLKEMLEHLDSTHSLTWRAKHSSQQLEDISLWDIYLKFLIKKQDWKAINTVINELLEYQKYLHCSAQTAQDYSQRTTEDRLISLLYSCSESLDESGKEKQAKELRQKLWSLVKPEI